MTNIAEVTVAYVNPPRGRATSGSIKDTGGAYYGIKWPDWQNEFQPGVTYKIAYETNGQYKNITQFKAIGGAPAPAGHAGPQDDKLSERIFVCGAVNSTLGNPNVQPHELTAEACIRMVDHWRKVWAATFGKATNVSSMPHAKSEGADSDLNDSIPW